MDRYRAGGVALSDGLLNLKSVAECPRSLGVTNSIQQSLRSACSLIDFCKEPSRLQLLPDCSIIRCTSRIASVITLHVGREIY